jgi:hypothetical protein
VDPFQTQCRSENLVESGIEPGTSGFFIQELTTGPQRRSEVFKALTIKNACFKGVAPEGFVRTDVSEERVASIFRV